MASWQVRRDARNSAAVRAVEAQGRKIDQGNFLGALGHNREFFPGNGLPRPTRVTEKGRLWSFGN